MIYIDVTQLSDTELDINLSLILNQVCIKQLAIMREAAGLNQNIYPLPENYIKIRDEYLRRNNRPKVKRKR